MYVLNKENLLRVMEKEGMNQAALAKKLGVSRACVNRQMTGSRRYPSAKFMGAIKKAFPEYSFDYFFYLEADDLKVLSTRNYDYYNRKEDKK